MFSDIIYSFLTNVWCVFLVVLFFGGSIFVHELGHFLAARRRGVHVARFSIGFGPKIFSWKGRDGVEYRLSWLPLGGYVALPQLADMRGIEGEADAQVESLPPISYSTKMIVFAAGAAFNILFAFVLATTLWAIGRPVTEDQATTRIGRVLSKIEVTKGSPLVDSPAALAGLRAGDRIVAVDGRPVSDWIGMQHRLILGTNVDRQGNRAVDLTIERGGVETVVRVNPVRAGEEDEKFRRIGIEPDYNLYIQRVEPNSAASALGLRGGDRIATINDKAIRSAGILWEVTQAADPNATNTIVVERAGSLVPLSAPPGKKFIDQLTGAVLETKHSLLYENPIEQFRTSIEMTVQTLISLIHPRGDVSLKNLSGPIGIGRGFWAAAKSDFPIRFAIWFAVLVNLNLAIFNLLPIPVLDGGHMLFATIGRLRGRALPMNFIMTTQSVFIVLLFSMVIYVSVFDGKRWARDTRAERAERSESTPARK